MEGDIISMQDIFVFERLGVEDGKVIGRFTATGIRPKFADKLERSGFKLPSSLFEVAPSAAAASKTEREGRRLGDRMRGETTKMLEEYADVFKRYYERNPGKGT
jgi:hypothetical protein